MHYYYDECDKTTKIEVKIKHLKNLSSTELDKRIRIKHTIKNPDFFDIDSIFKEYITKHDKKLISILFENVFKLVFDKIFHALIQSEIPCKTTIFHLKSFYYFGLRFSVEKV